MWRPKKKGHQPSYSSLSNVWCIITASFLIQLYLTTLLKYFNLQDSNQFEKGFRGNLETPWIHHWNPVVIGAILIYIVMQLTYIRLQSAYTAYVIVCHELPLNIKLIALLQL